MVLILIGLIIGILIGTGCYVLEMVWWGALLMVLTGLPIAIGTMFLVAIITYPFNRKVEYVIKKVI